MIPASTSLHRLTGLMVLGLLTGCGAADADTPAGGVSYEPPAGLARLEALPIDGDDIGLVRDFDMAGDSIYLLDMTGRVAVIERGSNGFRLVGHIGRKGGGPGELMQPTSVAVAGGNLVVADGARLHFFTRSGEYLKSKWLTLPCTITLPSVAAAEDGMFVYGSCLRRGYVTDTMKAVLAWSADTTEWEVIVEAPRFTTDGSLGSIFGASNLLTTGTEGRHAFGGGEVNCLWSIYDRGGRPNATEICPAASTLYSADPPPGLEAKMRTARFAGMNLGWPESLPAYGARIVVGDRTVLVRPYSADSVVLQLSAPSSADVAVAPHNGLMGCKALGCLWLIEEDETPRLIVLDRADLVTMLEEAGE